MSRGTQHNAYNRARQRAREEAEFKGHGPPPPTEAELLERKRKAEEEAEQEAERRKGLELCSVCRREFFRSVWTEVGICVCPSCWKVVAIVKSRLTPDEFDKTTIKIKDSPEEFTSSISGPPGILDKLKIGTSFKLIVMARVAAEGASSAFLVKRYAETRGKLSVTLKRVNVEKEVKKLAAQFGLTEEAVRKCLNIRI